MIFTQARAYKFAGLFISILLFWETGNCFCGTQRAVEQASDLGELKLEGKYIQRLVMQRKDGRRENFSQPQERISLPVGEYRLHEVWLEGGYTCYAWRDSSTDLITVTPGKPALLKAGAPLTQKVKVERHGGSLVLNYELLGVGGEKYASGDRSKPPTFTVYKNDKEIASDKFEFG